MSSDKTAFITGISGQDGAYLARFLLEKGYRVVGGQRRSSSPNTWRLDELGITSDIEFAEFELLEHSNKEAVLRKYEPTEFYNLGAQSFVATSFEQPLYTSEVDGMAVARILESIRRVLPDTRFYQASTSEMFGKVQETPQCETTPFYPRSPYGVAKLYAHWMTVNYREGHDLHASTGILFNHESPLRGLEFVTRKITDGLAKIAAGKQDALALGNLSARRDWGFAGDYVKGMWQMLQQEEAGDYVLATGETHSIRTFVEAAADELGMAIEWHGEGTAETGVDTATGRTVITVDPRFFRPAEVDVLVGDATKARDALGWTATVGFKELARTMARADADRHGLKPILSPS